MPLRTSLCLLILTAFWSAIYLPALAKRELQGEEARRILPGRTMLQTGEWMVPRSGGAIYNRKPPLVNWMSAGAISLTGRMDEWTVRLPATLMMLALGVGMFWFLRGWLGNDQALLAALITLTSIGFIEKGRIIEIEALYMSLFGLALVAWLGLRWQGRDLAAWVISGLFLGLGFLAKGPLHALYFYFLVIGVLGAERKLVELRSWRHVAGFASFLIVWVPWAVVNSLRNVQKDSGKVWADQITHRLGFSEFNFVNYLLQVPQSLVNFLPWALLLPLCWRVTYADDRHGQWLRGLRKGLVWAFFLIALLPSSRPRFMLPLNVAAALLVADALARIGAERFSVIARRWRMGMLVIGGLVAAVVVIAPWTQDKANADAWTGLHWQAWAIWLVVLAVAAGMFKRTPWTQPRTLGIATALVISIAASALALQVVSRQPWEDELRQFAAKIEAHTGPDEPILLFKVGERMWPFYLGLRCREAADVESLPKGIPFRWVIVARKAWDKESTRKNLTKLYGQPRDEWPLKEPHGDDDYVLLEMWQPTFPRPDNPGNHTTINSDTATVDTSHAIVTYSGHVVVNGLWFQLSTEGDFNIHLKRPLTKPVTPVEAADALTAASSTNEGTMAEFAIARGKPVVVEVIVSGRDVKTSKSGYVRFNAQTDDFLLEDFPQVQEGRHMIVATTASTTMTLTRDGHLHVRGPSRHDIIGTPTTLPRHWR